MGVFSELNGHMLLSFSENLAIAPYLLRSLRIYKMFVAREKYCTDDKIPRVFIRKWSEYRAIVFLVCWTIFGCIYHLLEFYFGERHYMILSVRGLFTDDGMF